MRAPSSYILPTCCLHKSRVLTLHRLPPDSSARIHSRSINDRERVGAPAPHLRLQPNWKKSSNGLDLDVLASLLIAIVVEPFLFVPEHLVNRLCQPLGTIGVHFGVGRFAKFRCNDLHRLKFPVEVAGEIGPLIPVRPKGAVSRKL